MPTLPAGSSAARSYPVSLVLSGNYFWNSGIASSQNTYGDWWSSWARQDDSVQSYSLDISASRPAPQYTYFKYVGFALRCVRPKTYPAGSSAARSYPVSLVLSGFYGWVDGRPIDQNSYGRWYSSSTVSNKSDFAYYLHIDSTQLYPQTDWRNKTHGFSLRWL